MLFYFSEFEIETIDISLTNFKAKENRTAIYDLSSNNRRTKREIASLHLKKEVNQELKNLMEDPRCKEGCEKIRQKLSRIGEDIESSIIQLTNLKNEISKVASSCKTAYDDKEGKLSNDKQNLQKTSEQAVSIDQESAGSKSYQTNEYLEELPTIENEVMAAGARSEDALQVSQQMPISPPQQQFM